MDKKKVFIWIFTILFLIVLPIAIYFTFFFYYDCADYACFLSHQIKCDKTKFTNNLEDATWKYRVLGKDSESCQIEVTLLSVTKGSVELGKLQGKSMVCDLEIGSNLKPEADVSKCHGILKEELQQLMINKLHSYIISNLGSLGEELQKVL